MQVNQVAEWMENNLAIRTKSGAQIPFRLTRMQRLIAHALEERWQAEAPVRVIILKSRQHGVTTGIQGWFLQKRAVFDGLTALSASHLKTGTVPAVRHRDGKAELDCHSVSHFADAFQSTLGKGMIVHLLHMSEAAFWPDGAYDALRRTVPEQPFTAVVVESSANGLKNSFAVEWVRAVNGKSDFTPIFVPWWAEGQNSIAPTEQEQAVLDKRGLFSPFAAKELELTSDESYLMLKHNVTFGQIKWRRWAIANWFDGRVAGFRREFPSCWQEAFGLECGDAARVNEDGEVVVLRR